MSFFIGFARKRLLKVLVLFPRLSPSCGQFTETEYDQCDKKNEQYIHGSVKSTLFSAPHDAFMFHGREESSLFSITITMANVSRCVNDSRISDNEIGIAA